ncbi:MAG TPA: iron-sulfur cluster assembly accessory protein [Candidatus Sulfotelmatobacter sp.]|jgi:iron-sulfur cluster assembly protein|nr:iron-sulfur cluster assembly accessory protein [Candidatus Sulfotelmatobacter sp.]
MLVLTDTAIEAVRRVMQEADDDISGLRIGVETGGCSGLRYKLELEVDAQDGDEVLDFTGFKLFIGSSSQTLLAGVEVDFVESVEGSGFVFDNPNAADKCGCGKSFC